MGECKYNSFYFAEELLSTAPHKRIINVNDRATLFNLLIGFNGYAICTGILNSNLNGDNIISVPLKTNGKIEISWIKNKRANLSGFALKYIDELKKLIVGY